MLEIARGGHPRRRKRVPSEQGSVGPRMCLGRSRWALRRLEILGASRQALRMKSKTGAWTRPEILRQPALSWRRHAKKQSDGAEWQSSYLQGLG